MAVDSDGNIYFTIDIATSGDNTIIDFSAQTRDADGSSLNALSMLEITEMYIGPVASAVAITFKSGSTAKGGAHNYAANGGANIMVPLRLNANEDFVINLGGNVQVSGWGKARVV